MTMITVIRSSAGTGRSLLNLLRNDKLVVTTRAFSAEFVPTIKEARDQLKELVGSSQTWAKGQNAAAMDTTPIAASQAELPSRGMRDSYREAVIPLGQNTSLRDKYVNSQESVRVGRIMEDLDTMAVWIGYTHNQDPEHNMGKKSPLSIVTAMVDRIEVKERGIRADSDIQLSGHVSWAGSTSLEISMAVKQDKEIIRMLPSPVFKEPGYGVGLAKSGLNSQAVFVDRGAFVNPLIAETEEEKLLFQQGEDNNLSRKTERGKSLLKTTPNAEESLLVHNMFLSTLDTGAATFKRPVKPEGTVWMEDTLLKNVVVCFPQERNLYNKIFGGFLMRQAIELAWANSLVYTKQPTSVKTVDDIVFRKPVQIGSLLYLSSMVVYTDGCNLQVKVHAEVVDHKTGMRETTNVFHFTFSSDSEVPRVVPKTYAEFMMYLDGKRHYTQ